MTKKHALFSPSSAHRWIRCPGSVALCDGLPDQSSDAAREGTALHEIAARCLREGKMASHWLNTSVEVEGQLFEMTEDRIQAVDTCIKSIQQQLFLLCKSEGDVYMQVEANLPLAPITGEEDAEGTADLIILHNKADGTTALKIIDLKFGYRKVIAEWNFQLALYAAAAYHFYNDYYDITEIEVGILQPRTNREDFWKVNIEELQGWLQEVVELRTRECTELLEMKRGGHELADLWFNPSEEACEYCKAAAKCSALEKHTFQLVRKEFEIAQKEFEIITKEQIKEKIQLTSNERLSSIYFKLPILDIFKEAVVTRIRSQLEEGKDVPGLKLVQGRRGNREWGNAANAEAVLSNTELDESLLYTKKLVTPAALDKLLKKDQPEVWEMLQPFITRKPASVSIAAIDDKREAIDRTSIEDDLKALD